MSEREKKTIVIDALTIRRGGGHVLLVNLATAIANHGLMRVVVLCNPDLDLMAISDHNNIEIVTIDNTQSAPRAYLFRHKLLETRLNIIDKECSLISFNGWSRSKHKQITIHINTIPFLSWSMRKHSVGIVRAFLQKLTSRTSLKISNLNIFESQYLLDLAQKSYSGSIASPKVRYFGTDLPYLPYQNLRTRRNRKQQLISVTSGAAHKQNLKVVNAFREIRKNKPELELVFVGNKKLIEKEIEQSASGAYVDMEGVKFLGYLSRDALINELSMSLALVSLSNTESFYLVAIEAMFCGTPVLVKRIASAEESCGDHAILLDSDTPTTVAGAFQKLDSEHKWLELSKKAHQHAAQFESEACMQKISNDIYEACSK